MQASQRVVLEARKIRKEFPGVVALDSIDFTLREGEVHALVGENGAGKSTLVKILTGAYPRDSGGIYLDGIEVSINSVHDSMKNGISVIYQEFSQVPSLSIAENLFMSNLPQKTLLGVFRIIDWKSANLSAEKQINEYGLKLDPKTRVKHLGVAPRQIIEIAKALLLKCKILIMDEPTSALSKGEIAQLFTVVKKLREKGVSIIYISHRLDEIHQISDRVTVLKDGKIVGTRNIEDITQNEIVNMMIGRKLQEMFPERKSSPGKKMLEVKGLTLRSKFDNISFDVREGEILGITGVIGSGKTELARVICGIEKKDSGDVIIDGRLRAISSSQEAASLGIGLLPENRNDEGVILCLNINDNISLPTLTRYSTFGFINVNDEKKDVSRYIKQVDIRPQDPLRKVRFLSGGNRQKVVLAKWLCSRSRIYIFDEPTRGIDIGAKAEIYKLMANLANNNCAVIMISSELPEIIGMSDRVLLMKRGAKQLELSRDSISSEKILGAMMGS